MLGSETPARISGLWPNPEISMSSGTTDTHRLLQRQQRVEMAQSGCLTDSHQSSPFGFTPYKALPRDAFRKVEISVRASYTCHAAMNCNGLQLLETLISVTMFFANMKLLLLHQGN